MAVSFIGGGNKSTWRKPQNWDLDYLIIGVRVFKGSHPMVFFTKAF
jgi:hypothetical protein